MKIKHQVIRNTFSTNNLLRKCINVIMQCKLLMHPTLELYLFYARVAVLHGWRDGCGVNIAMKASVDCAGNDRSLPQRLVEWTVVAEQEQQCTADWLPSQPRSHCHSFEIQYWLPLYTPMLEKERTPWERKITTPPPPPRELVKNYQYKNYLCLDILVKQTLWRVEYKTSGFLWTDWSWTRYQ